MSNKELVELLKSCSPNIIYVVNDENRIIKLKTPLKLLALADVGDYLKNQIVICTELKITTWARMVFHIDGKNYHTYYFDIIT
jgi:hypothetical protein